MQSVFYPDLVVAGKLTPHTTPGLFILQYCIGIASIVNTFSVLPKYCNTTEKIILVLQLPRLFKNIGLGN
jgi:hypothetical protein